MDTAQKIEIQKTTIELGLWEQIKEDWITHGRDWTKPGFQAVVVQRFGVWRMQIKSLIVRAPFSFLYLCVVLFL
ncbi:MAG: hypothetical protein ACKPH7_21570 [Planktothrix sp.]|uniref:hypothetical protein n=1 Tax=Planktothrix sp. TaxID=3088171 RepID=UPI0038D44F84